MLIAMLLLQMTSFQAWVDHATLRLGIKSITVVESTKLSGYAAASDSIIYIHPLLVTREPPSRVLQHLAYHEVCHVYLKHYGRGFSVSRTQNEANECAMTMFFYGKRKDTYFKRWNRWIYEHPFPMINGRQPIRRR